MNLLEKTSLEYLVDENKKLKAENEKLKKEIEKWKEACSVGIGRVKLENEKFRSALELVNDHAETCSIFVYDEKGCTCFYDKIKKVLDDSGISLVEQRKDKRRWYSKQKH
jgi:regulator of replication initiation timing